MSNPQASPGDQLTPESPQASSILDEKTLQNIETIVVPSSSENTSADLMILVGQALQAELQAGKPGVFEKLVALREQQLQHDQEERQEERRLREKEIDQKHELATKREARLAAEAQGTKATTRLIIGAVTLAYAGALGYAVLGKDSSLADKVFTGAMGLLGGGGAVALSQRKNQSGNP